jgi:hypothetical protein
MSLGSGAPAEVARATLQVLLEAARRHQIEQANSPVAGIGKGVDRLRGDEREVIRRCLDPLSVDLEQELSFEYVEAIDDTSMKM